VKGGTFLKDTSNSSPKQMFQLQERVVKDERVVDAVGR
jgi:hypothetical protein